MADSKRTRSPKRHSRLLRFSEVKGKILETVEVDPDLTVITILFEDKTVLSFDLDPLLIVFPELGNMKTGNWRKSGQQFKANPQCSDGRNAHQAGMDSPAVPAFCVTL